MTAHAFTTILKAGKSMSRVVKGAARMSKRRTHPRIRRVLFVWLPYAYVAAFIVWSLLIHEWRLAALVAFLVFSSKVIDVGVDWWVERHPYELRNPNRPKWWWHAR